MNLKNWFRPAVLEMRGYTPGEQPRDTATVKLNTNENPYPPSAAVSRAVREAAWKLRLYPEPACDTLRERLSRLYRWPREGILVGNGSDEILSILFNAAVGRGDLVQYPDLTYSLYPVLARIREARTREARLDGDFGLDFGRFSTKARLTLWGHPNPPAGNCFTEAGMEAFLRRASGLALIDEAYVDFADRDCLGLARRHPNAMVLRTLSKSFSLAGARLGFLFGHPSVVAQLMKVKDSYNVNRLTQAAGLAALGAEGLRDMERNVRRIRLGRGRLAQALRGLGFAVADSQANFLLAARKGAPTAESLYKNLKKKHVLVRYFPHPRLKDSLRITVGTPAQNHRLVEEIRGILNSKF